MAGAWEGRAEGVVRRLRASLLTALAVGAVATGVAAGAPARVRTVTLWVGNDYRYNGLKPLEKEFNESHRDIQLEIILRPDNPEALAVAAAGGAAPNLFVGAHSWDPGLAYKGLLVDLWPLARRDGFERQIQQDFFPGLLQSGSLWKGGLYSLPLDVQMEVLYYNTDLFREAGLEPPQPGWTWTDLEQLLPKARRTGANGQIERHAMLGNHWLTITPYFMAQVGATWWDPSSLRPTIRTEALRQVLTFIRQQIDRDLLRIGNVHGLNAVQTFLDGKAALHQDGNYRLPTIEGAVRFARVAPPLRAAAGGSTGIMGSTRTLALVRSGDAEQDQAAWQVLKWLLEPQQLTRYGMATRLLLPTRSANSRPDYRDWLRRESPNLFYMGSELVALASGAGRTAVPGAIEAQNQAIGPTLIQYYRGQIALEAALQTIEAKVDEILAPYR